MLMDGLKFQIVLYRVSHMAVIVRKYFGSRAIPRVNQIKCGERVQKREVLVCP